MSESSTNLHEPIEKLNKTTLEFHRIIVSIIEELEAIDWYQQRIDATEDKDLKAILSHNRDEEKEHAAMSLEWLRRNDSVLDKNLKQYLFTEGSIVEQEEKSENSYKKSLESLEIGSLKGDKKL
jgi:ferritin-like protein